MAQSVFVQSIRLLVLDVVGGVLAFPVWWYGRGLMAFARGVWDWFATYRASLAIGLWIKNIFVPMYGTRDIGGRLISFIMRVAVIVGRSAMLWILGIVLALVFVLYLALPVVVVALVLYHGIGSLSYDA